jgi:hypothetical protein
VRYLALLLLLSGCGGPTDTPTQVSAKASEPPVAVTPDPTPVQGVFTISAHIAYQETSDLSNHYVEVQPDQSVYMFALLGGENYIFEGTYDGQLVSGTWCVQDLMGTTQMGAFSANVSLDSNNMPIIDATNLGNGFIWQQMAVDATGWVGTRPSC